NGVGSGRSSPTSIATNKNPHVAGAPSANGNSATPHAPHTAPAAGASSASQPSSVTASNAPAAPGRHPSAPASAQPPITASARPSGVGKRSSTRVMLARAPSRERGDRPLRPDVHAARVAERAQELELAVGPHDDARRRPEAHG